MLPHTFLVLLEGESKQTRSEGDGRCLRSPGVCGSISNVHETPDVVDANSQALAGELAAAMLTPATASVSARTSGRPGTAMRFQDDGSSRLPSPRPTRSSSARSRGEPEDRLQYVNRGLQSDSSGAAHPLCPQGFWDLFGSQLLRFLPVHLPFSVPDP